MTVLVLVQTLVTLSVLSFAAVAAAADLNRTHATNPVWVGHARFHVVWQVATHIGVGVVALVVLWTPVADLVVRLAISGALSAVILVGFFLTAATMRFYGGEIADSNGYRPIAVTIRGCHRDIDQNVVLFASGSSALAVGAILACTL